MQNVAEQTEYQNELVKLRAELLEGLKEQHDPRVFGNDVLFDGYTYHQKGFKPLMIK
jgi:hypothetical protein